jgi:hypothetical protein
LFIIPLHISHVRSCTRYVKGHFVGIISKTTKVGLSVDQVSALLNFKTSQIIRYLFIREKAQNIKIRLIKAMYTATSNIKAKKSH